jgi:hypothetical protein
MTEVIIEKNDVYTNSGCLNKSSNFSQFLKELYKTNLNKRFKLKLLHRFHKKTVKTNEMC